MLEDAIGGLAYTFKVRKDSPNDQTTVELKIVQKITRVIYGCKRRKRNEEIKTRKAMIVSSCGNVFYTVVSGSMTEKWFACFLPEKVNSIFCWIEINSLRTLCFFTKGEVLDILRQTEDEAFSEKSSRIIKRVEVASR